MKNIDSFQIFEGYNKFRNYSNYYRYTGSNPQPGYQEYIYDFFRGMRDRFENFNNYYKTNIAMTGYSGQKIDTGLGWLIGKAGSLGSTVAMKIFEPQEKKPFTKIEKDPKDKEWLFKKKEAEDKLSKVNSDGDVTPEHQRLFNSNFVKNDLPAIQNDDSMKNYIFDFYKKAGVPPGKNKVADETAATLVTSYYNKKRGVMPSSNI